MWMVWCEDNEYIFTTENKEEAEKEYEKIKQWYKDSYNGEPIIDGTVVLAKVEKIFYSEEIKKPVNENNEKDNKIAKVETKLGWVEDIFYR